MPPRNPSVVQLDNPALVDQTIRDLQLMGTVGLLNFSPEVVPVYLIGDAGLTVSTTPITYESGEIFGEREANPGAGQVKSDTGQLAAGTYDVKAWMNGSISAGLVDTRMELQHRNAANTATLAVWGLSFLGVCTAFESYEFSINIALNERLRVEYPSAMTGSFFTTIMLRRRTGL